MEERENSAPREPGLPEPEQPAQEKWRPATRGQRIAAWIGVVLMVALVLAYSYSLATGAFLWW